ncbi:MAG: TetR/AcrR family transcriptional regulator [Clostridia bacterium]
MTNKLLRSKKCSKSVLKTSAPSYRNKEKIYEAAKSLTAKYGHEAVSIDDIVREAGVARGSFYVYYLSKEDLLVSFILEGTGKMNSQIMESWNNLDRSLPAADLIVDIACYISDLTQSAGIDIMRTVYRIFIERSQASNTSSQVCFNMPDIFTNLYNLGVSRGEFKPANADEIAMNITTILVGLTYEWCLYHPNYSFTERARKLVAEYMNGFKI